MSFPEWWQAYAKKLKPIDQQGHKLTDYERVAKDAWCAAIDQAIESQRRVQDSRRGL